VIWSGDGVIVTNSHVVEAAANWDPVLVEFSNGHRASARIAKRDRYRDVAILQLDASDIPPGSLPARLGDSKRLRAGELVIAVGSPLGFTGAATSGVVHRTDGFSKQPWVISQLRLAPGNSGGPLANAQGQVIGINTLIVDGLAFAIPTHAIAELMNAEIMNTSGSVRAA
jgi:serine protease Do